MYRLTDAERGRNTAARYNIVQTEEVLFVTAGEDGMHKVRTGMWWLVPHWAKERDRQRLGCPIGLRPTRGFLHNPKVRVYRPSSLKGR
jgi:putative SOS response-associated peptidase YedK